MAHNTPPNASPQRETLPRSLPLGQVQGLGSSFVTLGSVIPAATQGALEPVRSLYIHVPFCFHKCHYCDFYSIVDTQDRQDIFTDRLIQELRALAPYTGGLPLKTIFVGGGTPSLLRPDLWSRVLQVLAESFDMSDILAARGMPGAARPQAEFTVECNPETVTRELMDVLVAGGVTRVSMGAQSFESRHLKTLERWHNPENVARALEIVRTSGVMRQSIDLIFGVPGQTLEEWERDLSTGLSMGTEHISCYSLTYEPATAMTARLKRGEFQPIDEDIEVDMHRATWRLVRAAGLERYEVSNFAKPGSECLHNLAYWRQESWLALGPSASGHIRTLDCRGGYRWKNAPRLDDYLRKVGPDGTAVLADHELPDPPRLHRERIMTGLRLAEGMDAEQVLHAAEELVQGDRQRVSAQIESFKKRGFLIDDAGRWKLTDEGILFADGIAAELF
jgi:oxygen-independent coproporphyrinogen-3 oxidase